MRAAAVVAMVYNESENLPLWVRHYSAQVGIENCFVIDHGSTDRCTAGYTGLNVLRVPRTPCDDRARAKTISDLASALAPYFRYVICTDADELLVVDPAHGSTLEELCTNLNVDSLNSIGLDVCQVISQETELDPSRKLGQQRSYVRFNSSLCKPNIARPGTDWAPGFHGCQHDLRFGPVYLFHWHWADARRALRRLALTRSLEWAADSGGEHHRLPDQVIEKYFDDLSRLQIDYFETDRKFDDAVHEFVKTALEKQITWNGFHCPPFDLMSNTLFEIPPRLKARL